jgi:transposase
MERAKQGRRRHSAQFKQRVLSECERPGASVAAVALSHGINTNLVHKWRRRQRPVGAVAPSFIPVTLNESAAPVVTAPAEASCIEVDVRRGATALQIRWPISAAVCVRPSHLDRTHTHVRWPVPQDRRRDHSGDLPPGTKQSSTVDHKPAATMTDRLSAQSAAPLRSA